MSIFKRAKKSITSAFELPADVMLHLPLIHLTGGSVLWVENHRGILEYAPTLVRISTGAGPLTVRGRQMVIASIGPEDILVRGEIAGVHFESGGP